MTYAQFRNDQYSFPSSNGTIKFIDKGTGPVIVLLHGVPTSGWLYRKMMVELSKEHRVIIPDMLGFGSSDSPKGYDIYSPKEHAKRLLELMAFLSINKWHHVFHDAGGLWTWELLKEASDSMLSLTILNTIIFSEGFKPPIRLKKGIIAQCIMALYSSGIFTNLMLKGLFKSGLMENDLSEIDLQGYKTPLREGKTKAMYHFFSQTCNDFPDYSEVFKKINVPIQIIWGKYDSFLVFEDMKQMVGSCFNLKAHNMHFIEAKHFIQEELPEEINGYIFRFLNDLENL